MFSLGRFWRVQSPSCSLKNPPWGYKPGTVPSLKGTYVPLEWCGVSNTTARVSNMTESAQPHISTSVWRSLFLYIQYIRTSMRLIQCTLLKLLSGVNTGLPIVLPASCGGVTLDHLIINLTQLSKAKWATYVGMTISSDLTHCWLRIYVCKQRSTLCGGNLLSPQSITPDKCSISKSDRKGSVVPTIDHARQVLS